MGKDKASILLARLRGLHKPAPYFGICSNVGICFGDHKNLVKDWPHFTGDYVLPIPSTKPDKDNAEIYRETQRKRQLWDRRTKYGRLRWDLVNHLIRKLVEISGDDRGQS